MIEGEVIIVHQREMTEDLLFKYNAYIENAALSELIFGIF